MPAIPLPLPIPQSDQELTPEKPVTLIPISSARSKIKVSPTEPERRRHLSLVPPPATENAFKQEPTELARGLARSTIEIIAGAREIEQLSRWVTDETYRKLEVISIIAARKRKLNHEVTTRPLLRIGNCIMQSPNDRVRNGVIAVWQQTNHEPQLHTISFRLEHSSARWRASVLAVI